MFFKSYFYEKSSQITTNRKPKIEYIYSKITSMKKLENYKPSQSLKSVLSLFQSFHQKSKTEYGCFSKIISMNKKFPKTNHTNMQT